MGELSNKAVRALKLIEEEYGTEVFNEIVSKINVNKEDVDISVVNKYHIALLQKVNFENSNYDFGSPEIDGKKPYGNSDVIGDIKKITGLWYCDEGTLEELHYGLIDVLNLLIHNPDKSLNDLIGTKLSKIE